MFSLNFSSRFDIIAARDGWESDAKEWRAERAAFWLGSVRRLESIAEGATGSAERETSWRALSGGGRRRDCHVWLSA